MVSERVQGLSFLGLLAVYAVAVLHHADVVGRFVVDDTFIFLRYADHLAGGAGLVFNPGERVEGYTSFLWVLWLALAASLHLPVLFVAQLSGVVLGAVTLLLSWRIALWFLPRTPWLALLVPACLATNRTFSVWAIEGMDVKLFGALVALCLLLWLHRLDARGHRFPVTGLSLGLTALARPEGLLVAALLGGAVLADPLQRRRIRAWLAEAAAFLLVVGSHLAFRLVYYGDLVPNTFHAKVAGLALQQGWHWLVVAASANHVGPCAPLVAIGAWTLARGRRLAALTFLALLLGWLAYLVAIGGDYFEFRFLDAVLPLWALFAAAGIAGIGTLLERRARLRRAALASLAALALGCNALTLLDPFAGAPGITTVEQEARFTRGYVEIGLWLARNLPPGESIALRPAGAIPYLSRAPTLDLLGLNDREIARGDEFVIESAAGHRRRVGREYARARGATYWIGQPTLSPRAMPSSRRASVEIAPGVWFSFEPLAEDARFGPGVYPLGTHAGQARRPF